ncbi:MAG: hypothetical protein AAFP84_13115 [Actinomycetota bacterium]
MSTVVISGSVRDQSAVRRWVEYWVGRGNDVVDAPKPIPQSEFHAEYPEVFRHFYDRLADCDVLFVMNEDRDGVVGYVGAATFAELSFAVARNVCGHKPVEIVVLKPVGDDVHAADEIRLWADLGWITFHESVGPAPRERPPSDERLLSGGCSVRSADTDPGR